MRLIISAFFNAVYKNSTQGEKVLVSSPLYKPLKKTPPAYTDGISSQIHQN